MQPRLKHFGWGRERAFDAAEEGFVFGRIERLFGTPADREVKPPRLEDIKLAFPRLVPPVSLPFCSTALYDRAAHTYGKSFPDYVRGLVGDYSNAPDVVAYPRTQEEVAAVLDWRGDATGERDSVRRRIKRCRRSRATARCGAAQRGGDDRPARTLPRVGSRQDLTRCAHRGRRVRAGIGGSAQAARAHVASFPAKFRVLDARRLDRDPLRRSFRHALHPHRRSR